MDKPASLYHYTNGAGLLGIIDSKSIWTSKIHYLNDSREFIHAVELATEELRKRQNVDSGSLKETLSILEERIDAISRINVFVASFSEAGDSLDQWRGYCPAGAGYSIGFGFESLVSTAEAQGYTLERCIYDGSAQRQAINKIIDALIDGVLGLPDDPNHHPRLWRMEVDYFLNQFVKLAPTIKACAFSEEREWRLISNPIPVTDHRWRTRVGRSMLIPYIPFRLTNTEDIFEINEVRVGPTPYPELAISAVTSLLSSKGFKRYLVGHSSVPFRSW